jgi:hypothetical protein
MKLVLGEKHMDIGTAEFNFMRTLMVAATGGADVNECLLVVERIRQNDQESWVQQWARTAEQLRGAAEAAAATGQPVTARQAYFRASNYFRTAMLSLPHTDDRLDRYLTASRECFHAAAQLSSPGIEVVAIKFGGASLPGYFLAADPRFAGPRPSLLALNGGDSTNEELVHWLGFAAAHRLQPGLANRIVAIFADEVSTLIIGAAVDRDQDASGRNVREQDGRIVRSAPKAHPKDVDRSAELDRRQARASPQHRMPTVGGDDELCVDHQRTARRLRPDPGDARARPNQIGGFGVHFEPKRRKPARAIREKVQEVPLRHDCDELAPAGNVAEVGVEEPELIEHLQR